MVTTKRRIATEQDRFGGYGLQLSGRTITEDETAAGYRTDDSSYRSVTDEPIFTKEARNGFEAVRNAAYVPHETYAVSDTQAKAQPPIIEYSSRPYYTNRDYEQAVVPPIRVKKSRARKREKEDIMPSIRTRAYAEQAYRKEEDAIDRHAEANKISGKTKAALVIYMVIVLILAVTVIATGLAINNINAQTQALENQILTKNEMLTQQNAQIAKLTDKTYIMGAATQNGMESAGTPVEVELVSTTEPVKYEGRTNWFDRFCDWLSNIIGG